MEDEKYKDIINLPHHISSKHHQMSMEDRAAQFAPYAALTGYGDAVKETARLTEDWVDIDEEVKIILDEKINIIKKYISSEPEIIVMYFKQDERKKGGKYVTIKNKIKKIDEVQQLLIMQDGLKINIKNIFDINGKIFEKYY